MEPSDHPEYALVGCVVMAALALVFMFAAIIVVGAAVRIAF